MTASTRARSSAADNYFFSMLVGAVVIVMITAAVSAVLVFSGWLPAADGPAAPAQPGHTTVDAPVPAWLLKLAE